MGLNIIIIGLNLYVTRQANTSLSSIISCYVKNRVIFFLMLHCCYFFKNELMEQSQVRVILSNLYIIIENKNVVILFFLRILSHRSTVQRCVKLIIYFVIFFKSSDLCPNSLVNIVYVITV